MPFVSVPTQPILYKLPLLATSGADVVGDWVAPVVELVGELLVGELVALTGESVTAMVAQTKRATNRISDLESAVIKYLIIPGF